MRRLAPRPLPTALLGGYALVAVVVTWPLVATLPAGMPGVLGDQPFYIWCIDTFWTRIFAGRSPLFTDRVLYPVGVNLMHVATSPAVSLAALPFLGAVPLYLALVVMASLVAAAYGTYRLALELTGVPVASAIGGLCFGFGPTLLAIAESSHVNIVAAAALLPWGLLALLRFVAAPSGGALAAASVIAWVLVFIDYYTTVMFLVVAVVTGTVLATRLDRRHVRLVAVALAANVAFATAVVLVALPSIATRDLVLGGHAFTSRSVTNLVDYLAPASVNPVLGRLGDRVAHDRPNGELDAYFLGFGVLALALVGAWRGRHDRRVVAVGVVGAVMLLLACGTAVRFGARELAVGAATPWYWLARIPPLDALDVPRRFALGPALAVGVLVAVALAAVPRRRTVVVSVVALVLVAVEYGRVGMAVTTVEVPDTYRRLAARPGDRTVLELPSGLTESKGGWGWDGAPRGLNANQMFWQTIHRKPRVGGYLSRIPRATYAWFEQDPVIHDLWIMANPGGRWRDLEITSLPAYTPEQVERFVRLFALGYVVLPAHPRQPAFAAAVERLLAGRITDVARDDAGHVLYTLR